MITMSLDCEQTINAWDLPGRERAEKDQVAFPNNLTRHMLGEREDETGICWTT